MYRIVSICGIALLTLGAAPVLAESRLGGAGGGNPSITTQGGPAAPAPGTGSLPGGAPGVQRPPLNAEPGANEGAVEPVPPGGDAVYRPNAGGGVGGNPGATMSRDQIWQACMMEANPSECRTRLRGGVADDSIERNPP